MTFLKLFRKHRYGKVPFEIVALVVCDSHPSESPVLILLLLTFLDSRWHFLKIDQKALIRLGVTRFEIGELLVCDSHANESPVSRKLTLAITDIFISKMHLMTSGYTQHK